MASKRQQAIRRRRIFIMCCVAVLALCIIAVSAIAVLIKNAIKNKDEAEPTLSVPQISSEVSEPVSSEPPSPAGLDPNYTNLLLVNGKNPLPQDYDYGGNLITIEAKYHNGQLNQIDAQVWPYMKAMLEAAWEDGVDLKVWSPYRSYDTQQMLFNNQVQRCINKGFVGADAENEAATVVARPGTSEHNTGLCADFNMASDTFETTPMYTWMCENAEDYGFILRYPKDKIDITGVIYESWHWRFVGIKTAREMNAMGVTLEEYVQHKSAQ